MKTGFVIVNYNDFATTKILLENIKTYKIIDEIVVVDNFSSDNSYIELEKIKNNFKNLVIIKAKSNKGFSAGLNLGGRYLIGKYGKCNIFFSNADIIIKKEQNLIDLVAIIKDNIVIVAPTIIEKGNKSRGWKIPSPMQEVAINLPIVDKIIQKRIRYKDEYYTGSVSKVDTISGCFFLMASKHLEDINYFDENVFLYYEENIFGIKTKRLNKKTVVSNNIEVIHNHSVSIDKSIKRIEKVKIQKKSQYYFEKEYNNANCFQLGLIKTTQFIGKILLTIKYFIGR